MPRHVSSDTITVKALTLLKRNKMFWQKRFSAKTLRLMIFRREICKRLGDFGLCTALPMSREHFDIGQTLKWTVWNGLF